MNLDEAKKILKNAGFLVENIDDVSSREELIEMILEHPCRDENITLEILKTWSFEELEKYHEECDERYMDEVYGEDRDGIDEALETLKNAGLIVEDTDDWDEDDLDPNMSDEERHAAAWDHNKRRKIWGSIGGKDYVAGRHVDMEKEGNNTPAGRAWTKAMARNEKDVEDYKRIAQLEDELKRVRNPAKKKEIQQTLDRVKNRVKAGTAEWQDKMNWLEGEDISMFSYAIQRILKDELAEKGKKLAEAKGKNWFDARWWIHIKHAVDEVLFDDENYTYDFDKFKKALNPNVDFNGDPNEVARQIAPDVWKIMAKRWDDWTY